VRPRRQRRAALPEMASIDSSALLSLVRPARAPMARFYASGVMRPAPAEVPSSAGRWFGDLRADAGRRLEQSTRTYGPARRLRYQLVLRRLAELDGRQPLRILDAGAGDGQLGEALARRRPAWRIVAADRDREMLERGRRRMDGAPLGNLEFMEADLTGLFGTETFDVVLAVECLVEIPDDEAALRAMARALRPRGRLLAHVPRVGWRPVLPGSPHSWRHQARHGYGVDEIRDKVERAGLTVTTIDPTTRGAVFLGQEISDRLKGSSLRVRAAALPITAGSVAAERAGLTWGPARALLVEARRN
jgi:SAM-dependent methyltransferase